MGRGPVRERPAYQRLRELRGDAGVMDRDVLDTIERDINEEVRARFPGTAVRQAVLLQYGDDPEIGPGDLWVRVLFDADRPQDYEPTLMAFRLANNAAIEQFRATWQKNSRRSGWSSTRSARNLSPATATGPG